MIAEHPLGRVADLGYEYRFDVRLVYPVQRHVHRLERAQRRGAEVPLEHDRLELFCGPLRERGRDGLLGGLAPQNVEQILFMTRRRTYMSPTFRQCGKGGGKERNWGKLVCNLT